MNQLNAERVSVSRPFALRVIETIRSLPFPIVFYRFMKEE